MQSPTNPDPVRSVTNRDASLRVSEAAELEDSTAARLEEPLHRFHDTPRVALAPMERGGGEDDVELGLQRGIERGMVLDVALEVLDAELASIDCGVFKLVSDHIAVCSQKN